MKILSCLAWSGNLFMMVVASSVFAANPDLSERYPSGSIQTTEQAMQALDDVKRERDLTEQVFLDQKDDCLQRFFVSSCLNKAKENRRQARKIIRTVEVEANAYLRKEKADERDRGVAERQRKAEQEQGNKIIPLPDNSQETKPRAADKKR